MILMKNGSSLCLVLTLYLLQMVSDSTSVQLDERTLLAELI